MKIIAYYLPQFHEIKENNIWWGKGFTEWTNVKKAKPLFSGHSQPKVPLAHNYYNLLEEETMLYQNELSKKYGIYGFCFYHYWFKGRKILEKPAENLLKWEHIKQNFCFCWANHTWKKSWNGTQEILIPQTYGDITEWEEHFNYLITFFSDKRYIKKENKPVFLIYSSNEIPQFDERVEYYNQRCKDHGFDGIYVVELIKHHKKGIVHQNSSAIAYSEPAYSMSKLSIFQKVLIKFYQKSGIKVFSYPEKKLVQNIVNKNTKICDKECFLGSFNGWDNTPRHKKRGYVIEKLYAKDFKNILIKQKRIMKENNIEYLFFNAWNEWAEGMYLEPDEEYKYKYLEVIKEVMDTQV